MMECNAVLSEDRQYRYFLSRVWNWALGIVVFVMLNPSTANEKKDDNTTIKCIKFADIWGYGGIYIINLFAFRTKEPKELYLAEDPIGPENDSFFEILKYNYDISKIMKRSKIKPSGINLTVAAWGNHGSYMNRSEYVLNNLLFNPHYLKLTKKDQPQHPLYIKGNTIPIPFN